MTSDHYLDIRLLGADSSDLSLPACDRESGDPRPAWSIPAGAGPIRAGFTKL